MSKNSLLDTHALLTLFQMEKGFERVRNELHSARKAHRKIHFSLVSYGEFCYILERRRGLENLNRCRTILEGLPIQLTPISREVVELAAHYKVHFPISFADAICGATAKSLNASLFTADPDFKHLEKEIEVIWTR